MRKTLLFLLITMAYVFVSERDYQDIELITTHMAALCPDPACQVPGTSDEGGATWHMAQNR